MAIKETGRQPSSGRALSTAELATVSAICNRVSRMLGLLDREGLKQDIAIVQASRPINLDALAGAPDAIFVKELMKIVDLADRENDALYEYFTALMRADPPWFRA
ncbi:MAG: hypothetical protein AB8B57_09200 [Congregibacter sp.]